MVWNAGRENTEGGRNGEVCNDTCYHVLRHVGPSRTKGDTSVKTSLLTCLLSHNSRPVTVGKFLVVS